MTPLPEYDYDHALKTAKFLESRMQTVPAVAISPEPVWGG
jgi:hypothetical protein